MLRNVPPDKQRQEQVVAQPLRLALFDDPTDERDHQATVRSEPKC